MTTSKHLYTVAPTAGHTGRSAGWHPPKRQLAFHFVSCYDVFAFALPPCFSPQIPSEKKPCRAFASQENHLTALRMQLAVFQVARESHDRGAQLVTRARLRKFRTRPALDRDELLLTDFGSPSIVGVTQCAGLPPNDRFFALYLFLKPPKRIEHLAITISYFVSNLK